MYDVPFNMSCDRAQNNVHMKKNSVLYVIKNFIITLHNFWESKSSRESLKHKQKMLSKSVQPFRSNA